MPSGIYPRNLLTLEDRFWPKVIKTDGCWLWNGAKLPSGYGHLNIRINGSWKTIYAHRLSWILNYGDIPAGMDVLHHCDNPPCVNPLHLFIGTMADNIRDRDAKHRGVWLSGDKSHSTKISDEQIREIRNYIPIRKRGCNKRLAIRFGTSKEYICNIRCGRERRNVK